MKYDYRNRSQIEVAGWSFIRYFKPSLTYPVSKEGSRNAVAKNKIPNVFSGKTSPLAKQKRLAWGHLELDRANVRPYLNDCIKEAYNWKKTRPTRFNTS